MSVLSYVLIIGLLTTKIQIFFIYALMTEIVRDNKSVVFFAASCCHTAW